MMKQEFEVLQRGDESGNEMIVRIRLFSGRDIFGFATENAYGGEWDLGPTWNYLIDADPPFLMDTGRRGMGMKLMKMLEVAGIRPNDLDFIILSHGHEDHDGGAFEIAKETGKKILAHETYDYLIHAYPTKAPSEEMRRFPASCWSCRMPQSFYRKHCLDYHYEKGSLKITRITDSDTQLSDGISVHHVPGHAPDAIVLFIDEEIALVGDTILPGITPHPTQEKIFKLTETVLPDKYKEAQQLYGLRAYIHSLKKIQEIGERFQQIDFLPAHRLFYDNHWNSRDLSGRVRELIDHHIERCKAVLEILRQGPRTADEIAREYFDPALLKGYGSLMAVNEILSHCELMEVSNDVILQEDGQIAGTGKNGFESLIKGIVKGHGPAEIA